MKSFGVRVTAGSKTFIVGRKFNGRTVRLSIGRFPESSKYDCKLHAQHRWLLHLQVLSEFAHSRYAIP